MRHLKRTPNGLVVRATPDDFRAIDDAIHVFRNSTAHAVDGIADQILREFHEGELTADSIERLSKWANSGATFAGAVDPAKAVASLLLGCSLDRLIDEEGRRMIDYATRVVNLAARIGAT